MQVQVLSPAVQSLALSAPSENPVDQPARPTSEDSLANAPSDWHRLSWRERETLQQPSYPDRQRVEEVFEHLASLPPLVTSWEIETLRDQLAEAALGNRFLLQGGDCAERFDECNPDFITSKLKILLQMSLVLVHGGGRRITRVGRFAGQYAKPRSANDEVRDGVTLPSYRGDNVNRPEFTPEHRVPDPERLLRGHEYSALTLNFIRALIDGGFADLHHPEYWNLEFVEHSPLRAEYERMVESIGDSLRFMETVVGAQAGQINRVDFFTSHEALLLLHESAMTRSVPRRTGWWNLGTHMPWLGVRTAEPDGGHVEYLRGIRNPLGLKVGPSSDLDKLVKVLDILDPDDQPGRITLIHRFGASNVSTYLPALIDRIKDTGRTLLFSCDPMHGNTETVKMMKGPGAGRQVKTRKFGHILAELEQSFEIHQRAGTILGGVHFELTGDQVTECTGGARGLEDDDLATSYRSHVDPRLNYEQSLEMAMLIAGRMARGKA
ncbi:MAG: 3-deoxy-7-phosphoheptulonate synthase class II [Planctomycetes bacterium TMED75]|nr:3-deoxy-7-phosphoheptulonate synthase class II [Planctomycetaceae bacterium]OUU94184.1 MAG: 3-deoxy-7-phosphoheptulonate synthase class II [Planctomycetes bacterium TMED75]